MGSSGLAGEDSELTGGSRGLAGGSWKLVQEIKVNVLECKVCFERYSSLRRPCSLPCGHAVCRLCLGALSSRAVQPMSSSSQPDINASAAASAAVVVAAITQPVASQPRLQCPFCRKLWAAFLATDCLPLLQLAELVDGKEKGNEEEEWEKEKKDMGWGSCSHPTALTAPAAPWSQLRCRAVLGGWGQLLNPTGIAVCRRLGQVTVAHDGKKRIRVFDLKGKCLREFGSKEGEREEGEEEGCEGIRYPLDVAVTRDGLVLVTDAGASAVKVFTPHGRCLMILRESWQLPWGLDTNSQGQVAVADAELGSLSLLHIDFPNRTLVKNQLICSTLCQPREVAVCPVSGFIHVVEHLRSQAADNANPIRLNTFNNQNQLVYQTDSFKFSLLNAPQLWISGITVDGKGNVLISEANHKAVVCLGNPQSSQYRTIISQGLSFPMGLVCVGEDTLIVLDSGDHSFKIYTES